jgi:hypothetical protein
MLAILGAGAAGLLLRPGVTLFAAESPAPPVSIASADTVLIEAEAFAQRGGWVLDQQFMDRMGSPMLLAHGLGTPVADAVTTVRFPRPGTYRVFVRTRDWIGPWKRADAPPAVAPDPVMCCGLVPITPPPAGAPPAASPGVFQLLVDGQPLPAVFGAAGAAWHWESGGTVTVGAGETTIALRDLTGCEGRCEALLFTSDPGFAPPDDVIALAGLRRHLRGLSEEPVDGGTFDLVVCGGGIAGMCAALGAAQQGLKTILIQDRPVVGGNNSAEVGVWLMGAAGDQRVPRLGAVLARFEPPTQPKNIKAAEDRRHQNPGPGFPGGHTHYDGVAEDQRREAVLRAQPNLTLLLGHRIQAVILADGTRRDVLGLLDLPAAERNARVAGGTSAIAAVDAEDIVTGERQRIRGGLFADCTGDACVGFLAGADAEESVPRQGETNLWAVADTGAPAAFPDCSAWALDLRDVSFPGKVSEAVADPVELRRKLGRLGLWNWESGFNRDPFRHLEEIRDWNFRAMYGAVHYLKNVAKTAPNHVLSWAAYIAGKRESRRLLGDVILDEPDILEQRPFPDAVVPTSWAIDVHVGAITTGPLKDNAFLSRLDGHRSLPGTYLFPYRCLYSRNIPNLFMAGRCISATRRGLGSVRVQRTCGLMGEVVALAAALCRTHGCTPRTVYERHLPDLLAACGAKPS